MSIYLFYLIGFYTLQQYQTSSFMEGIQVANNKTGNRNKNKEFLSQYIHTPAYQTQVAKANHNKKLPGEEVINIIRPADAEANMDRDPANVIAESQKREEDPTKDMNNPQKWWYILKKGL